MYLKRTVFVTEKCKIFKIQVTFPNKILQIKLLNKKNVFKMCSKNAKLNHRNNRFPLKSAFCTCHKHQQPFRLLLYDLFVKIETNKDEIRRIIYDSPRACLLVRQHIQHSRADIPTSGKLSTRASTRFQLILTRSTKKRRQGLFAQRLL